MAAQKSNSLAWGQHEAFKVPHSLTLPFPSHRLSQCAPPSRRKHWGSRGDSELQRCHGNQTIPGASERGERERQSILSLHRINISAATAAHAHTHTHTHKSPRHADMHGRFEEISIALAVVRKGIYIETLTENSKTFLWCLSPTEAQKCDAWHCVAVTYRDIGRSYTTEASIHSVFSRRLPCDLLRLY